jgi:hypothetical protein
MEIGFVGRGREEFWIKYVWFHFPNNRYVLPGRVVVGAKLG